MSTRIDLENWMPRAVGSLTAMLLVAIANASSACQASASVDYTFNTTNVAGGIVIVPTVGSQSTPASHNGSTSNSFATATSAWSSAAVDFALHTDVNGFSNPPGDAAADARQSGFTLMLFNSTGSALPYHMAVAWKWSFETNTADVTRFTAVANASYSLQDSLGTVYLNNSVGAANQPGFVTASDSGTVNLDGMLLTGNSVTFTFADESAIQLNAGVPEPASLIGLSLGLSAMLRRRRLYKSR